MFMALTLCMKVNVPNASNCQGRLVRRGPVQFGKRLREDKAVTVHLHKTYFNGERGENTVDWDRE